MTTQKAERIIRRIRQRIFDYSSDQQDKAGRLIEKLKALCATEWKHRHDLIMEANMRHYFL